MAQSPEPFALPAAPNNPLPQPAHRIGGVDVLRGLSILAVIILHIDIRIWFDDSPLASHLSRTAISVIFHSGYYGVMVFFVISGFLITSLSFRRWGALRDINVREFYTLRFARIVPCLVALLAISSALHIGKVPGFVIDPRRTSLGETLWSAITLHINVLEVPTREHLPGNWDVLWSLSIEEVFYLGFPLICKLLKKEWALYSFMLLFVFIGPFSRALNTNPIWADHSYFSCFDGIAIGFFAAAIANKIRWKDNSALALWAFGCAAAIFAVVCKRQVHALGLYRTGLDVTLLEIATACIILGLRPRKIPGANLLSAPLRWFGRNSYEIYLTHCFLVIPAGLAFRAWHAPLNSAPIWYVALVFLSGLLGWLVARFYSEPINRGLRQRMLAIPQGIAESAVESETSVEPA